MKDTRYAFCVARIRALENRLLTKKDIEFLINQQDLTSAFDFLIKNGYAIEGESVNELISRHANALDKLLRESAPDKKELDRLYLLNDYFNIKVLVKCAVENINAKELMISPSTVTSDISAENGALSRFSLLKENYRQTAEKAYDLALKSGNGKYSDTIVDRAAIDSLCSFAQSKGSGLFGQICGFLSDCANIKIALRCSATYQDSDFINEAVGRCYKINRDELINATVESYEKLVSYLKSSCYKDGVEIYIENPSAFDKWCDEKIIEITSSSVYTSFGFAPVIHYFYCKTLEIKTVRMILSAIKSGVDKDIIKERVRKLYA